MKAQLNQQGLLKGALLILAAMCLAFTVPAFAKDTLYASNISTVTVDGSAAAFSTTGSAGANRNMTLTADITVGLPVSMTVRWSIETGGGTATGYPRNDVGFSTSTSVTPGPAVAVNVTPPAGGCDFGNGSATCDTSVSFTAPNTTGTYQIEITPNNTGSPPNELLRKKLVINFSVIEPVVQTKDTVLTVAPQCLLYRAGNKPLTAELAELVSGDKIPDAAVDFYVDPPSASIGSASTDAVGVATLVYNVDSLTPGDHTLYAEFLGDASYNASNDSATLGISYMFVGFRQPINADGTSVFGNGRVIPVKIKIADANGQPVTDAAPTVWVTQYSSVEGLGEVLEPASSVSAADSGNTMRYVPEEDQYIYNWDLSSLVNGTYAVVVDLNDSDACHGPYYAIITVSKKGKK